MPNPALIFYGPSIFTRGYSNIVANCSEIFHFGLKAKNHGDVLTQNQGGKRFFRMANPNSGFVKGWSVFGSTDEYLLSY